MKQTIIISSFILFYVNGFSQSKKPLPDTAILSVKGSPVFWNYVLNKFAETQSIIKYNSTLSAPDANKFSDTLAMIENEIYAQLNKQIKVDTANNKK